MCRKNTASDPNARLCGRHTSPGSACEEWLQAASAEQPPPLHCYAPSSRVPQPSSTFPFLPFQAPGDIRGSRSPSPPQTPCLEPRSCECFFCGSSLTCCYKSPAAPSYRLLLCSSTFHLDTLKSRARRRKPSRSAAWRGYLTFALHCFTHNCEI